MGLKKTNYINKEHNIIIPEAYAVAECNLQRGTVIFHIATSRELALAKKSLIQISFPCSFARDINPYKTAYMMAKGTKTVRQRNFETRKFETIEVSMPFADWEDDIVIEEKEELAEE